MTPECVREAEILDAIADGRWPDAVPEALLRHAGACATCADLALAASAIHDDAAAAIQAPIALPSAGQVWWRAELRARQERAQLAQRPMLAVQVVATVVCLAAAMTALRGVAPDAWTWIVQTVGDVRFGSFATMDTWTQALVLSVGLWLVLGPIAVVMVLRADRQGGR